MSEHPHPFEIAPVSKRIWEQKYRLRNADGSPVDRSIDDTWARIAGAAAGVERGGKKIRAAWADKFTAGLSDFGFLPAGRIIAGAGTPRAVTLFNCFVMGRIEDDLSSIFEQVREAALTMQAGGGIGHDFSTLRPRGALVRSIGADASGPVSFMDVWDAMCRTIMSAGARRGAMMATMRCDHPDIEEFIAAKADARRLRNFNLSVLVTDPFVAAVRARQSWDLVFEGKVYRTVDAGALWDKIMRATYDYAEPGVIFIDRINRMNNLAYCEEIRATNPCGEQPLPAYGACLLGSINLMRFVDAPFSEKAGINLAAIEECVRLAVRFLDNVVDVSHYPLAAQAREARAKRRIGLGVTGLADALIACGLHYGEVPALAAAEAWMAAIQNAAYVASAELAAEKGAFPLFDAVQICQRPNITALPSATRALIAKQGLRNGCLTSIAPTGTISLLAGNISSGIEPVFDFGYRRRILEPDGRTREEEVEDYAHALYRRLCHEPNAARAEPVKRREFVSAGELAPKAHLDMQAAIQRHVDSSISKTINCPADMPFDAFKDIYLDAYDAGLKGCTTFRPNAVTGSVLEAVAPGDKGTGADTEADSPSPVAVAAFRAGGNGNSGAEVVYMSKPLARDPVLAGFTYKLTWPGQDNALYVTINDMERGDRRVPFEIFINTKNLEHYAWTVALTRMISAIFRRGGDLTFVVEELKAIFDPQGGRWMEGRYVPSLLAAIGEVIEVHMVRIGFMVRPSGWDGSRFAAQGDGTPDQEPRSPKGSIKSVLKRGTAKSSVDGREDAAAEKTTGDRIPGSFSVAHGSSGDMAGNSSRSIDNHVIVSRLDDARGGTSPPNARFCPRCGNPGLVRIEGCWSCPSCGYAHCD